MSFWGRIFGAPDVVSKTTDAVIAAGDKLFYTQEEKAEAGMKRLEWILKFHEASSGSNIARRFLAVMMVFVFLLLIILNAVLVVIGWEAQAAAIFKLNAETLVVPVGIIIAFYFTSGMVRDFTTQKKQ